MKTKTKTIGILRPLRRCDLPKRNSDGKFLNVPVIYKGIQRKIADIHLQFDTVCYLKDNNGIPVKIADLILCEYEYYKSLRKELKYEQGERKEEIVAILEQKQDIDLLAEEIKMSVQDPVIDYITNPQHCS